MRCDEFRSEIERRLDQQQPIGTLLEAHTQECDSVECGILQADVRLLEWAVRDWNAASRSFPKIDAADWVLAHYQAEIAAEQAQAERLQTLSAKTIGVSETSSRGMWAAIVSLVTVASVMVALTFRGSQPADVHVVLNRTGETSSTVNSIAQGRIRGNDATETEVAPERMAAAEEEELEELGIVYTSWMKGASSRVTDTVTYVFAGNDAAGGSAPPAAHWWKSLSDQFTPLEETLDTTIKLLFEQPLPDQTYSPRDLTHPWV